MPPLPHTNQGTGAGARDPAPSDSDQPSVREALATLQSLSDAERLQVLNIASQIGPRGPDPITQPSIVDISPTAAPLPSFPLPEKLASPHPEDERYLRQFFFRCECRNLRPDSIRCYTQRLSELIKYAHTLNKPLLRLTREDLEAHIHTRLCSVSAASINGIITAFKVYCNHLIDEGVILISPARKLRHVRGDKKLKQILSPEDVSKILTAWPDNTFFGDRNRSIVLLAYDSMLRVGEILRLRPTDLDLGARTVTVTTSKNHTGRVVPFGAVTAYYLGKYCHGFLKDAKLDFLFVSEWGDALSVSSIMGLCCRARRRVGIYFHMHLLRHSGNTQYLRQGGRKEILKVVAGHKTDQAAAIYNHLNAEDAIAVHADFSPAKSIPLPHEARANLRRVPIETPPKPTPTEPRKKVPPYVSCYGYDKRGAKLWGDREPQKLTDGQPPKQYDTVDGRRPMRRSRT